MGLNGLIKPENNLSVAELILIENVSKPLLLLRGVVVITTAKFHSTKLELKFCPNSNPAHGVSEIRNGENLWQWSPLETRLNAFRWSTLPQKQFNLQVFLQEKTFDVMHQRWNIINWILFSSELNVFKHYLHYLNIQQLCSCHSHFLWLN